MDGYKGNVHQKFKTLEEANRFIASGATHYAGSGYPTANSKAVTQYQGGGGGGGGQQVGQYNQPQHMGAYNVQSHYHTYQGEYRDAQGGYHAYQGGSYHHEYSYK